jgi:hypothetical protein
MNKKHDGNENKQDFFAIWMKATSDLSENVFRFWHDAAASSRPSASSQEGASGKAQASVDAAMKTWRILTSTLSQPGAMNSIFKGAGTMPEILIKMAQTSLTGFLEFQHKYVETLGRVGKSSEAYTFEDLDENAFRAWSDIYEKEFRQYFNIPQLGLTRFYQEKINQAQDKFNLFQAAMSEFLRLLYLPVTKSYVVVQEKLEEMAEKGDLPEDPKQYYQMWIKILEGHYMTLFQSSEYGKAQRNVLNTMSDFSVIKNDLMQDMLRTMPVATQKDLDDLYKEVYLLKKRIKVLENNK